MCLGIPGKIVAITNSDRHEAIVEVSGVRRGINIALIVDESHPTASCVGDWVLVHVGFAMSRMDEVEAARTLALLTELGEAQADIEAMSSSARAARDEAR